MTLDKDRPGRRYFFGLVDLSPREKTVRPPSKYKWLVPTIVVVAVLIVAGGIIATIALGVNFF